LWVELAGGGGALTQLWGAYNKYDIRSMFLSVFMKQKALRLRQCELNCCIVVYIGLLFPVRCLFQYHHQPTLIVLELVSQIRDVVLMNVYLDLGSPGGLGFWNEGYMNKGREVGRSVYEQPGNEVDGSCHSKEGSK
jgi:hypothetical protein